MGSNETEREPRAPAHPPGRIVGENIWNIEKHKSEAAVQLPRTHSLENGTERGDEAGQSWGSKLQAGEAAGNLAIAPPDDGGRETANQEPDAAGSISHRNRRSFERGHRPKLLVPVDATSDCRKAVYYASRRAARIDGHLVLLRVIEPCLPGLLGVREILERLKAIEKAMLASPDQQISLTDPRCRCGSRLL
jgi:hypothetical protein